jgi:hypothetical protein
MSHSLAIQFHHTTPALQSSVRGITTSCTLVPATTIEEMGVLQNLPKLFDLSMRKRLSRETNAGLEEKTRDKPCHRLLRLASLWKADR